MHKEWYGEKIQLIPSAGKLANVWQSYKKQERIHQAAETDYVKKILSIKRSKDGLYNWKQHWWPRREISNIITCTRDTVTWWTISIQLKQTFTRLNVVDTADITGATQFSKYLPVPDSRH